MGRLTKFVAFTLALLAAVAVGTLLVPAGNAVGPNARLEVPPAQHAHNGVVMIPLAGNGGGSQLAVLDVTKQTLAIYYVENQTGKLTLQSVREIRWDLQMKDFNGSQPLPREIQAMLK